MDWLGRWESGWDGSPPFGFPSPPLVPGSPPFGFPSPPFHRPSPPTRLVGGLPAFLHVVLEPLWRHFAVTVFQLLFVSCKDLAHCVAACRRMKRCHAGPRSPIGRNGGQEEEDMRSEGGLVAAVVFAVVVVFVVVVVVVVVGGCGGGGGGFAAAVVPHCSCISLGGMSRMT